MTSPVGDELVLRPTRLARVVGWCLVGLGLVFSASGMADPDDTETLLTMVLAGLAFAAAGLTLATALARVSAAGVRYRNGLQRRSVPADNVTGISVGPGSGARPRRLAYVVHRGHGRSVRLIGIQRWESDSTAQEMLATASAAEVILGLASTE